METQVYLLRTLERISTYISPLIKICRCTGVFCFILFVPFSLQAEIYTVTSIKNLNEILSQHVARCNGNEGSSLPTRAHIATRDKYPGGGAGRIRNAIAFEDPSHSRSHGVKAPIAIHISIFVGRGRLLPLGLSPPPYVVAILHATKLFPLGNLSHTGTSYLVYSTVVWTRANQWKTIMNNAKRGNGLYPPTHSGSQAFASFEQML